MAIQIESIATESESKMSIWSESIDAAMADCIFPTDIMLSILTRLPAKSIQRFKFVSKLWCKLFSDPIFIKMYKGQFSLDPNNQSAIVFNTIKREMYLVNIDSNESPKEASIIGPPLADMSPVGCYNGIVCMIHYEEDAIFLWNPAMEMYQCIGLSEIGGRYTCKIDCDDGTYISLGLGYDAEGDDFKLVRIVSLHSRVHLVEVYSLNSDAWTRIDFDFGSNLFFEETSVVTVNGNPYWAASYGFGVVDEDVLVYFDVKLLVFRIIPKAPPQYWMHRSFMDWNGTFGYLEWAPDRENTESSCVKVWLYEDGWICKHTIGPIKLFFDSCTDSSMICSRNWNVFGCQYLYSFVYDHQSKCVEDIETLGRLVCFYICGYTANFERTLKKFLNR